MSVTTVIRSVGDDGRRSTMELEGMRIAISQYQAEEARTTRCSIILAPAEALALMAHIDRQLG